MGRQQYSKFRRARGRRGKCPTGKVRFRDGLEAQNALVRARNSESPRRRECRSYYCEECGGFHLTSQKEH